MKTAPSNYLFCEVCGEWMPPYVDEWDHSHEPYCGKCGEAFTCGECGYEIDLQGNCQRPPDEDGTRCPESEIER